MPIANFTLGQATRYIIAGITEVSAGDNCTIWVDQGVQCGGQVRPHASPDTFRVSLTVTPCVLRKLSLTQKGRAH